MSTASMDINCDCGESFGNWKMGRDEEVFPLVTSVNLACGFHAGDAVTMVRSVRLAKEHGVAVGAHPGLPDLLGFGRRVMRLTPEDVYAYVVYQIGALQGVLTTEGMTLHHVKPHGALFGVLHDDPELGDAAARAFDDAAPGAPLYWPFTDGDQLIAAAQRLGMTLVGEIYPDLAYRPDGTLVLERLKQQTDAAEAGEQVRRHVREGAVRALDGSLVHLEAGSICVHGDGPNALEVVHAVRRALEECGCAIEAPPGPREPARAAS